MTSVIGDDDNTADVVGYGKAADTYWEFGWRGVLPLKRGAKWPPPNGFTGYSGAEPSYPDILQWRELYPDGNLCLRLPDGIVGIDVDAYGSKTGGVALAEAQRRWGPLPDGPISSSREDDLISGIRLFRVPPGTLLNSVITFPDLSVGDIEVIQRHHRYAVCWPSIHPEGRAYWWRNSAGQIIGIPNPAELPDLPAAWIEALKLTPKSFDVTAPSFDVRKALTTGEQSMQVSMRMAEAIKELNLPGMSRHDTALRHVMALLRMGAEGQAGVESALQVLREVFVSVTAVDGSRTRDYAIGEFNRMVTNNNVARELSQPGITDWFSKVLGSSPDVPNANADRADNAGAEAPPTEPEDEPSNPEPSLSPLEVAEEGFWEARESLNIIYSAALSRMVSPWATLAWCAAIGLHFVPPDWTLPALVGGPGSLNWFAAVVDTSGAGKTAAGRVAKELIGRQVFERNLGSGEGLIQAYESPGEEPRRDAVLFTVDEVDTMKAMSSRSGQTTSAVLRTAFSGGTLGFSYVSSKLAPLAENSYRMTMVVNVQPTLAGPLIDAAQGGMPQRLMWFPAQDPRIRASLQNDWIPSLPLPRFESYPRTIDIPDEARQFILAGVEAAGRGAVTELDTHANFCREKLAFALAVLDGRTEMNVEDWELSGVVQRVSTMTRDNTVAAMEEGARNEAIDRGQLRGVEMASAEWGQQYERTRRSERVMAFILRKLDDGGPDGMTRRDIAVKMASRDRALLDSALTAAVTNGVVAFDGTRYTRRTTV